MAILRPIPRGVYFDPIQLQIGTRIEMEHTANRRVAEQIAKHHLLEDPDYYRKLQQVHLDEARVRLGLMGKVGLAPGTTTMTMRSREIPTPDFGSPWNPAYPDAHQRFMPKGATIVGGAMTPHDFELARIFAYTPYMQGWTVANILGKAKTPETVAYVTGYLQGLGQVAPTTTTTALTPEQVLERQLLEERLKSEKTIRTWTIIGGAVGIAGLFIAILSLGRR